MREHPVLPQTDQEVPTGKGLVCFQAGTTVLHCCSYGALVPLRINFHREIFLETDKHCYLNFSCFPHVISLFWTIFSHFLHQWQNTVGKHRKFITLVTIDYYVGCLTVIDACCLENREKVPEEVWGTRTERREKGEGTEVLVLNRIF